MTQPNAPSTASPSISRRTVFAGAGAAGALAAVATVLPAASKLETPLAQASKPAATGGYQLTDHVKQYYATARV